MTFSVLFFAEFFFKSGYFVKKIIPGLQVFTYGDGFIKVSGTAESKSTLFSFFLDFSA